MKQINEKLNSFVSVQKQFFDEYETMRRMKFNSFIALLLSVFVRAGGVGEYEGNE